ncbi:MAG TPA: VOC family protein [Planctomycetota bacterium]|nr:VOC family protein [Planctomycetota bacterium]
MSIPTSGIVHIEIPAPDLKKATAFYSSVFSWKVDDSFPSSGGEQYAMFQDGAVGGGFDPRLKPTTDGIVLYIAVKDIPEALKKIAASGGSVIKEKTEIGGNHGYYALFKDPNGNKVGIWCKM